MSVVNYTNGGSAANALANFARPYGITPSDRLQTEQLPMSVLANILAGNLDQTFNVKALRFGAAGDGTTDDTTPIQRAINAASAAGGGTVYFPLGTYIVTGLTLASNVNLLGVGSQSVLKRKDGAITPVPVAIGSSASDFIVANIAFDGNKDNMDPSAPRAVGQPWEGLSLSSCSNVILRNVWAYECDNEGIDIDGGENIDGEGLYVSDNGGAGIHPSNGTGSLVTLYSSFRKVVSRRNGATYSRAGFYALDSEYLTLFDFDSEDDYSGIAFLGTAGREIRASVIQARIRDTTSHGFHLLNNGLWIDCDDVLIERAGANGFMVEGASLIRQSRWSNVKVRDAASIGIRIAGSGWILSNALVEDSAGAGVDIQTTSSGRLVSPRILRSGGRGIAVSSSNVSILDAEVLDSTGEGIYLNAVTDCEILGCRSGDTRAGGSRTQTYGVFINSAGASARHRIIGCDLQNNVTQAIRDVGSGHIIRNNVGANDNIAPNIVSGWYDIDAAVSTPGYTALSRFSSTAPATWVAPYNGTITYIILGTNEARTAGTLTLQVFINGVVAAGQSAQLNTTNTEFHLSPVSISFSAGDLIDLRYLTSVDWTPVTADITGELLVQAS